MALMSTNEPLHTTTAVVYVETSSVCANNARPLSPLPTQDIAGAITHKYVHHVFQGTGWNHAHSVDFVAWHEAPHGPGALKETHAHMRSDSEPCAGFLWVKQLPGHSPGDGKVCAGFRQCTSTRGTGIQLRGGGILSSADWDVPLEMRCAEDDALGRWSSKLEDIDYLFDVKFYRPMAYDPAPPWLEEDGNWYVIMGMDACNASTRRLPCEAGGQLIMWRTPSMTPGERGVAWRKGSVWEKVGPVFTSNRTVLSDAFLHKEFVTIEYIGRVRGWARISMFSRTTCHLCPRS